MKERLTIEEVVRVLARLVSQEHFDARLSVWAYAVDDDYPNTARTPKKMAVAFEVYVSDTWMESTDLKRLTDAVDELGLSIGFSSASEEGGGFRIYVKDGKRERLIGEPQAALT